MELIETSVFTKQIMELLEDEEYRTFQTELAANPAKGPIIRGGGGIRKIRVAVGSRGKSGGARVIYYWAVRRNLIVLLYAFPEERCGQPVCQTDSTSGKSRERGVWR